MQTPIDAQQLLELLSNFSHPFLAQYWAHDEEIVTISDNQIRVCFPFASKDLQQVFIDWTIKQQQDAENPLSAYQFEVTERIATLAIDKKKESYP